MVRTLEERFDEKWLPDLRGPHGCWVWTAYVDEDGYGKIRVKTDSGRWITRGAHVVGFELYVGPVPQGLQLDHAVCQFPSCVNPWHLEAVTSATNTHRGRLPALWWLRRKQLTHCRRGHPYSGSNLYQRLDGSRGCKACNLLAVLRYQEKHGRTH